MSKVPSNATYLRFYPAGSGKPEAAMNIRLENGEMLVEGARTQLHRALTPIAETTQQFIERSVMGNSRTVSSEPFYIAYDEHGVPINHQASAEPKEGEELTGSELVNRRIDLIATAGSEYDQQRRPANRDMSGIRRRLQAPAPRQALNLIERDRWRF